MGNVGDFVLTLTREKHLAENGEQNLPRSA